MLGSNVRDSRDFGRAQMDADGVGLVDRWEREDQGLGRVYLIRPFFLCCKRGGSLKVLAIGID
jgi:hypothetical protein